MTELDKYQLHYEYTEDYIDVISGLKRLCKFFKDAYGRNRKRS